MTLLRSKYTIAVLVACLLGFLATSFILKDSDSKESTKSPSIEAVEVSEKTIFIDQALKDPNSIKRNAANYKVEPTVYQESESIDEVATTHPIQAEAVNHVDELQLSSGQAQLEKGKTTFSSLRSDAIRNPQSAQNQSEILRLAQMRKARVNATETTGKD